MKQQPSVASPSDTVSEATSLPRPEVSVVMPCLNEADTLATCIEKAKRAMREHSIDGEIIVADNGSTDRSIDIAQDHGARVIRVEARGYGNALMGGIAAAQGDFIIMGDADDSYDFGEIPKLVEKYRQGNELVQGCRLPSGGGRVLPGAMPNLHRWLGNPLFSWMVRLMYRAPIHDVYCGLRGFTRSLYDRLNLRCTGMEFAVEMVIKSSMFGARIAEAPITLHPDGRKAHAPHLRTFRDGWRTVRFYLMYSPRWLFLVPGLLLVFLGVLGYALALPGFQVFGAILDVHSLLVASLAILLGYQSLLFALFTKTFAITEGLMPRDRRLELFFRHARLETGLLWGAISFIVGLALIAAAWNRWRLVDFGPLEYSTTMRLVIPGVTLAALGFQTVLSSFFVSILGMARK